MSDTTIHTQVQAFAPAPQGTRALFLNADRTEFYSLPVIGYATTTEIEISRETWKPVPGQEGVLDQQRYISPVVFADGFAQLADDLGDPFLDLLIGPYSLDADKGLRAAHKIPADLPLLNEWGTPIPVDAE